MPSTLVELTANIVSSHAVGSEMSGDELIQEINAVFATLKRLDSEGTIVEASTSAPPTLTIKQAFQKDQVGCMVCGKTGFKTLTRHIKQAHDLKPGQYRKQFNILSSQSLTAKNYSEARRKTANDNNLAANLEKARAVRAAKNKLATKVESPKPPAIKPIKAIVQKPVKTDKPSKLNQTAKAERVEKSVVVVTSPKTAKAVKAVLPSKAPAKTAKK